MTTSTPTITLKKARPSSVKADAIVVGIYPDGNDVALCAGSEDVNHGLGGRLVQTLSMLGATGRLDEVTLVPSGGALNAPLVVAIGLGAEEPTHEDLRRSVGAAMRKLSGRSRPLPAVAFALPTADAAAVGAVAEGIGLGVYSFDRYRSNNKSGAGLKTAVILTDHPRDKAAKEALARAQAVAAGVNLARDWVNIAPADLYPAEFVNLAKAAAKNRNLQLEVWDEKALAKDGYGGLLGVGKGSVRPPRLLRVSYRHPKAKQHLALVGKGITFDTGGLSLKPADSMTTMKSDMSGAAAVVAAITAIAELSLPVDVTVWAALAENMPSGSATRPSDVLTIYGGKTVEVLNTDAEGRLVLADALVRASADKPDLIVDVATLTGAVVVSLGNRVFGVLGDDDGRARVTQAAEAAGEASWPLPIPDNSRERLDSKVADLANVSGDRYGGALVAAAFLREFVGDGLTWAHLDIAGPAFNEGQAYGYTPRGGTGCGVRTLVSLAEQHATK